MNKRSLRPKMVDGPTYLEDLPLKEMYAFGLGAEYVRIVMLAMLQWDFNDEVMADNVPRLKDSLNKAGIAYRMDCVQVGQNTRWVLSFSFED